MHGIRGGIRHRTAEKQWDGARLSNVAATLRLAATRLGWMHTLLWLCASLGRRFSTHFFIVSTHAFPEDEADRNVHMESFEGRLLSHDEVMRFFDRADPARGRFRGLLKTALGRFALEHLRKQRAAKRGGNRLHEPIDGHDIADPKADAPERILDDAWRRDFEPLPPSRPVLRSVHPCYRWAGCEPKRRPYRQTPRHCRLPLPRFRTETAAYGLTGKLAYG